jgi:hypothetical protein
MTVEVISLVCLDSFTALGSAAAHIHLYYLNFIPISPVWVQHLAILASRSRTRNQMQPTKCLPCAACVLPVSCLPTLLARCVFVAQSVVPT